MHVEGHAVVRAHLLRVLVQCRGHYRPAQDVTRRNLLEARDFERTAAFVTTCEDSIGDGDGIAEAVDGACARLVNLAEEVERGVSECASVAYLPHERGGM